MTQWLLWIVLAYLVGSIPFGVLIARSRGIDIRAHGSKNIGATNVGRVLGKRFGMTCFALDLAKGAGPVLGSGAAMNVLGVPVAELSTASLWCWLAVAAASIAGHLASIFLRFAGGKGVATSFGAMAAMWPVLTWPALAAMIAWLMTVKTTRYISLASIVAAVVLPLTLIVLVAMSGGGTMTARLLHAAPPILISAGLSSLVIFRHRANIGRLLRGEEPRTACRAERAERAGD